jgi:hypothetical protein
VAERVLLSCRRVLRARIEEIGRPVEGAIDCLQILLGKIVANHVGDDETPLGQVIDESSPAIAACEAKSTRGPSAARNG